MDDPFSVEEKRWQDWIPAVVPLTKIMGRGDEAVLEARELAVYPFGFELELRAHFRHSVGEQRMFEILSALSSSRATARSGLYSGLVLSLAYSGRQSASWPPTEQPLTSISLELRGSHGTSREVSWVFRVSPLPDEGTIRITSRSSAFDVGQAELQLEAGEIVAASTKVQPIWQQ